MPKRSLDHRDENGKGRNCFTISVNSETLEKAEDRLHALIDCKNKLEDELEGNLDQIQDVNDRIMTLECKIEQLVSDQTAQDCKERMKEEILMIKDERSKAEGEVQQVKRKLSEKLDKLKYCKKEEGDDDRR